MSFRNVKLILSREVRDQLRDRRTLFMVLVLPIFLYPLLGMSFFQVIQFMQEKPTSVLVVGAAHLADCPCLFEGEQFAGGLFERSAEQSLLEVTFDRIEPSEPGTTLTVEALRRKGEEAVENGDYDAALFFPPDFARRMEAFSERFRVGGDRGHPTSVEMALLTAEDPEIPRPEVFHTNKDKSTLAYGRVLRVIDRWTTELGKANLAASGLPPAAVEPFRVTLTNVDAERGRGTDVFWAKALPVLLLVWAMTGAFYPAVDLCAGEKERGTLETLLASPAARGEIVVGKLGAVMVFSMATAVLNLVSLGVTGVLVLSRIPQFNAPPSLAALGWLAVALVPVSALFSALCLALAVLAKSTKEGQYYLIPLLMATMPLVVLPLAPAAELDLGTALIPVTGLILLLRNVIEGHGMVVLRYVPPVVAVTGLSIYLAIRWAAEQFNSESVLFRESERLDLIPRFRQMITDRQATPSAAIAVVCAVGILMVRFLASLFTPLPSSFGQFAANQVTLLLLVVAAPAVLLALLLTRRPAKTLLLARRPRGADLLLAGGLAVVMQPLFVALGAAVFWLYPLAPMGPEMDQFVGIMTNASPIQLIILMALVPAVCEELAFRGFILSGLRRSGRPYRAIIISAIFFGLAHAALQQSLIATISGLVIGLLAVRTGSILPCMVFHFIHNSLTVTMPTFLPALVARWPAMATFLDPEATGGMFYRWPVLVLSAAIAIPLLTWLSRRK